MIKLNYYDGHYLETDKTLEEIELELKELNKEEAELKEWPKID